MKGKAEVRAFVLELLVSKGDSQPLADDDPLFLSGRLQSIDAVNIVMFLEELFAIDFTQNRFTQEQIDSVDSICSLIKTATGSCG
jgi:acyl carrier protein